MPEDDQNYSCVTQTYKFAETDNASDWLEHVRAVVDEEKINCRIWELPPDQGRGYIIGFLTNHACRTFSNSFVGAASATHTTRYLLDVEPKEAKAFFMAAQAYLNVNGVTYKSEYSGSTCSFTFGNMKDMDSLDNHVASGDIWNVASLIILQGIPQNPIIATEFGHPSVN